MLFWMIKNLKLTGNIFINDLICHLLDIDKKTLLNQIKFHKFQYFGCLSHFIDTKIKYDCYNFVLI